VVGDQINNIFFIFDDENGFRRIITSSISSLFIQRAKTCVNSVPFKISTFQTAITSKNLDGIGGNLHGHIRGEKQILPQGQVKRQRKESKMGMRSSEFTRRGKPDKEDGNKIEKNGQDKGPEIILRLIEDVPGHPCPHG
jgi:hypothetical protein